MRTAIARCGIAASFILSAVVAPALAQRSIAPTPVIDLADYSSDSNIKIESDESRLKAEWPMGNNRRARVAINPNQPSSLIESLAVVDGEGVSHTLLETVQPIFFLTVGSRNVPGGKPPEQKWQVFFDKPANRPHGTFASQMKPSRVAVASSGRRVVIRIDGLSAGSFSGAMEITLYENSPLVHVEAVVRTSEDDRAMFYDAGLVGEAESGWKTIAWLDTEDRMQRRPVSADRAAERLAVRHRAIVAESPAGSVACFPPPHQFHYPRDWTNNFRFNWYGRGFRNRADRFGFGVNQDAEGGGAFVPWFNAQPGVDHRLGVFYLLSVGAAEEALAAVTRYSHGDRFPEIPGRVTMTSHYHMAIAVEAMQRRERGQPPIIPDFVRMFKEMNVDIVHLGEFHGDGHQRDPGPLRLPELQSMFDECRRLSDDELLLVPGEEVNMYLGMQLEGKHPGHWMSLFPKPVYWTMQPDDLRPFVEQHPQYGKVYHVGDRGEMIRLLKEEGGLVWAAHPRIKASSWTPDIFRNEDFFLADFWLGAAWKAMPGELSDDRLGRRVLDLIDDMANWGVRKYVPGEVDVFKLDRAHELYAHMNINYVQLNRLPRFDDGWQSLLDSLRTGQFFTTTGEVLIPRFRVAGVGSGDVATLPADGTAEIVADVEWTFPLKFAEVISGDGQQVYRDRIELDDTEEFSRRTLSLRPNLAGRHWVRFEVWDIATNGAYTQPVWLVADN